MPQTFRHLLHRNGPALWAENKPLEEVLELKATTPPSIWEGTYQGNPTAPEGTIYLREWWEGKNRYDPADQAIKNRTVGRWLSWDTGLKDDDTNAYSSMVVGELQPDYTLVTRLVYRERLTFPNLPEKIAHFAKIYNRDNKLKGVLIEDKASGTSAYQTLKNTAESWLSSLLIAFMPTEDKTTRSQQAAVWCRNNCILLPYPTDETPWLLDFEDELFDFPGSVYKDQVDAFAQLILWLENLLTEGWRARNAIQ